MNKEILIIKKEDILYVNMSKTASASEEPNLFELFRAPKVFEAKPQRALVCLLVLSFRRCKGTALLKLVKRNHFTKMLKLILGHDLPEFYQ